MAPADGPCTSAPPGVRQAMHASRDRAVMAITCEREADDGDCCRSQEVPLLRTHSTWKSTDVIVNLNYPEVQSQRAVTASLLQM